MSKYTTEIRYICEMKSGFDIDIMDSKTPDEIIDASRESIFNFEYPIYDEEHKPELEKKILKHYYTREIGAETFELWRLWLNARLNDIMPKFNKLYEAEAYILNKELKNIDITRISTRTDNLQKASDYTRTDNLSQSDDHTRTDNLSNSDTTRDRFSDTPQGSITNVDNDSYLTEYRNITKSGSNTGTQRNAGTVNNTGTQRNAGTDVNTGTQTFNETESGYRGEKIYASLLADYADKVLNIDLMIIEQLNDLFIMLW